MKIGFTLNNKPVSLDAPPMARLLDLLREDLGLTGSKEGCGEGECGACTVLIDGRATCSCLVPVCQVERASVTTVEGLAEDPRVRAVQDAFVRHGAAQCGICTPGFLVTAAELIRDGHPPDPATVRESIAGNLCRCTGYQKIVDAIVEVLRADQSR